MQLVEKIEITKPMKSKWIRADSLWDRIAGNMFFSTEEKNKIRFMIESEPGEDVAPVIHAHWVPQHSNNRTGKAYTFVCSNCKKFAIRSRQASIDELGYVFCPNCGAKMDEEKS